MPFRSAINSLLELERQRSVGIDPHRFDIYISLQLMSAALRSVAAHLAAAEGNSRIHHVVTIHPNRPGLHAPRELVRFSHISGPDAARQAKFSGVGASNHLFHVVEWYRADDRPKDFLARN